MLVEEIYIDKYNSFYFKQNNGWVNLWNLTIALLLQSNYNIIFIASANNAFAVIYYITNYTTKKDASQYQRIIDAAFMKNTYNQLQITNNTITIDIIMGIPDKFTLRAFNKLVYNWEIIGFFIANSLLGLSKHYTIPCNIKSINVGLVDSCFHEYVLDGYN